jgi:hypothetical protein
MDAAATSLPSATATRPVYSAAMPMAAVKAAADGAINSVKRPATMSGDIAELVTAANSSDNSTIDNCGLRSAKRSKSCTVKTYILYTKHIEGKRV